MKRYLIIVLIAALTSACGGGGGGSGGGGGGSSGGGSAVSGTPASQANGIAFSPSALEVAQKPGTTPPIDVTVSVNDPSLFSGVSTVYAVITDPSGVLAPTVQISRLNNTQYYASLSVSPSLAAGNYQGNFQLKLCSDSQCQSQVPGSPWVFPYNINVTAALYNTVQGLAFDTSGNLYVADPGAGTLHKITPAGVSSVMSAGTSQYSFASVSGVAADGKGGAFVTGFGAVLDVSSSGVVSRFAEAPYGTSDILSSPDSMATDAAGDIYFADITNNVIGMFTPAGAMSVYAGKAPTYVGASTRGFADGTGSAAQFDEPTGVAIDGTGNLYVADSANCAIRKIAPGGVVTTLAGGGVSGSVDGTGSAAQFNLPLGVAVDQTGNVYVTDSFNGTIRKVTQAGVVTTIAGKVGVVANTQNWGYADGTGASARFYRPGGIAVSPSGNIYVADTFNHVIRVVTPSGQVSTLIASGQ